MHKFKNFFIASPENEYSPPVLSYKAFIAYGIILFLFRLFFGFISAGGSAIDSGLLMQLINEERSSRNLITLPPNASLLTAAAEKAQDMIDRDFFAHVDPDGNYVWNRITRAGYAPYRVLGENLALDFSTSEGMIQAWIGSPTHRANLLHTEFRDQGLSAKYGDYQGRYTNLTASLFGTLANAPKNSPSPPPSPSPSPTPSKTPSPSQTPTTKPAAKTPTPALTQTNTPLPTKTPPTPPATTFTPRISETFRSEWFNMRTPFMASRVVFTLFGLFLLVILLIDSVVIYRHQLQLARSYSSYHLSTLVFIVLVSILIWWW